MVVLLESRHHTWQNSTKQLLARHGDHLVCVRYPCDAQHKKRLKTVQLIGAEHDWDPPATRFAADTAVAVRATLPKRNCDNA